MRSLPLVALAVVFISCQSGLIPCPTPKTTRLQRSHPGQKSYVVTARAEEEPGNNETKTARISQAKYIKNVTEEEWDCPEPGNKRYMPRHIKQNIRRNLKRMNDEQQVVTDTTSHTRQ